jgi:hypothetical protein
MDLLHFISTDTVRGSSPVCRGTANPAVSYKRYVADYIVSLQSHVQAQ